MSRVNRMLIENTSGKGRRGNAYKFFPTKYKSKYVPSNAAKRIAGK